MRRQYPVSVSCEAPEVGDGGYFNRLRLRESGQGGPARRLSDEALPARIRAIHAEVKGKYGRSRMRKELPAREIRVGKDRASKLMRQRGIRAKIKRKYVVTTAGKRSLPAAPDPAQRRFNPQEPNRFRRGDSACNRTDEGRLRPAAVIDLSGRQAVGRSLQPHMQTGPVKDAMAMARRRHRD